MWTCASETLQALAEAVDGLLATHAASDFNEEWDREALIADATDLLADRR